MTNERLNLEIASEVLKSNDSETRNDWVTHYLTVGGEVITASYPAETWDGHPWEWMVSLYIPSLGDSVQVEM